METSYIIKSVELETVCGITSTFPENDKIEIAFAGKSNVGKSSLINALVNRKALASAVKYQIHCTHTRPYHFQ